MEKYLVTSALGCTDPELEKAFVFALIKAEEKPDLNTRIVFVIHSNQNDGWFERMEMLKDFNTKQLFAGIKVKPQEKELTVLIVSVKNYRPRPSDVVIYTSVYEDDAYKIDEAIFKEAEGATCIALPILAGELENWKNVWKAKTFNPITTGIEETPYEGLDCISSKALDQMDINSYKGNTNSSDDYSIKTIVRTLFKHDAHINTNAVASYLCLHHKWNPIRAIYVRELLEKLKASKSFQGGETKGHSARIKSWKVECAKS